MQLVLHISKQTDFMGLMIGNTMKTKQEENETQNKQKQNVFLNNNSTPDKRTFNSARTLEHWTRTRRISKPFFFLQTNFRHQS